MKQASVIILTWNGKDYLKACLDAVLSQDYANFEVIVVDNNSSDGSADFVAEHYPQVRLIRNDRNLGFSGGNNVGLRSAYGDVLVLLNQDTVVQSGWLSALVTTLEDPTIGIVGCKLLYPDGRIQHAGGFIADARGAPKHIGRYEEDTGQYDQLSEVDYVTGAAMALTRKTLETIGPLDEGFFPAYYEDTDWCYRAREAGLRVVYCPEAVAIHYESASTNPNSYDHQVYFNHGRLRFILKHWSLQDLRTKFLPAESIGIQNLVPGQELEALRQAWVNILHSLSDIVQFRLQVTDVGMSPQQLWEALLQVSMTLRELCAKETPLYPFYERLQANPASDMPGGSQEQEQTALAALHNLWQIEPQSLQSEVPILGVSIAAFREAWLNVATRWYVQSLLAQQRTFNATVVQALGDLEATCDDLAVFQSEILHLLRQVAANTLNLQQDSAQHIRELNFLLTEVLRLQQRVKELEARLESYE